MECGSSACRLRNILQSQTLPGKIKSTVRMVSLQQYEVVNPATTSRQLVVEHSQEDQQGMHESADRVCRQGMQESAGRVQAECRTVQAGRAGWAVAHQGGEERRALPHSQSKGREQGRGCEYTAVRKLATVGNPSCEYIYQYVIHACPTEAAGSTCRLVPVHQCGS